MSRRKKKPDERVVMTTQSPRCTLTDELIEKFVAIILKGNFRGTAMQRLGISRGTYTEWMTRGREQIRDVEAGKRPEVLAQGRFVLALDEAEGIVHGTCLEDILESDSILARQWYLERRFNKQYSKNPNAHIDDETQEPVPVDPIALLADKFKQLVSPKDEE